MAYKMKGGELKFVSQIQMNDDFIIQYANQILEYAKKKGYPLTKKQALKYAIKGKSLEEEGQIYKNSIFTVYKYVGKSADEMIHIDDLKGKAVWLSIKRHDKSDNIKWSDKMAIMQNILNENWLGIEIYPPFDHTVDTANQYHLICFPPDYAKTFPFGWKHRDVNTKNSHHATMKDAINKIGQTYKGG